MWMRGVVSGPLRPHGILSFFDGSGSFAETPLLPNLDPQSGLLIAELDPDIRTVISATTTTQLSG